MNNAWKRWLITLCLWVLLGGLAAPLGAQEAAAPPWDGQTRYTILVLGMDRRPGARDTLNVRTDVVIVVSIDPKSRRLGILSIPRDMHFAPAGRADLVRVNTLLVEGEKIAEGYGPYLAMETLQLNLGMYIDAYIAFDFAAFVTLVDAIGGITVDVPQAIYDPTFPDMNYGYDPLVIGAGRQQMDGATALKYARTRHNDNDYQRGNRQLQIVAAVRERLANPAVLRELVDAAPQLVQQLQRNVYTNIPPEQLIFLGLSMMQVPSENVYSGAIGLADSFDYTNMNGEVVRVPDRERLAQLLTDIFGPDYMLGY